ncbi:MAG: fasciclin domain-containing protein [Candidatus Obscuribacterales bacterium]|jgi:uncharacterized surface protein with fasciclin (FAS1) repeats
MQPRNLKWLSTALSTLVIGTLAAVPAIAKDETIIGKGSTASTVDIVNELKRRGNFHKLLDGLSIAYNLDNQLKGKGPYTLFAPDDKAFSKLPEEDRQSLFGNPKRLSEVLNYHVIKGERLNCDAIKMQKSLKTMDPKHDITVSTKDDEDGKSDLYVDKAKVKEADINCSNGVIHIVDGPIMPPLAE